MPCARCRRTRVRCGWKRCWPTTSACSASPFSRPKCRDLPTRSRRPATSALCPRCGLSGVAWTASTSPAYRRARVCWESGFPADCTGISVKAVEGNPNPKYISTSYVERQNLNIRIGNRRMTRLTNAFSKKAENHAHMMAIYFIHYNFVRIHKTLKMTPAMAAGVTPKLWEMADMVKVLEDWEAEVEK